MIYEFQHKTTGAIIEVDMHPDEVPAIGETYEGEYMRIPSMPGGAMVRREVAFASEQFALSWKGFNNNGEPMDDPAPRRDAKGRPVFHNRAEALEFGRKNGTPYDEL